MKIKMLCLGKTNEDYLKHGIKIFAERLVHFIPFEIIELPDIKVKQPLKIDYIKENESEQLKKHIKQGDTIVLLDEKGQSFNSKGFAQFIEKLSMHNIKNLVFVVGGAYGFSDKMLENASYKISLSQMTFTHQMVRLIFVEQLYRAFSIIKKLPYHNE